MYAFGVQSIDRHVLRARSTTVKSLLGALRALYNISSDTIYNIQYTDFTLLHILSRNYK